MGRSKGFTLVELLVAMLMGGVVIAAIYTTFNAQRQSYYEQDEVTQMQQNLRAALDMMSREIRMAGYNPTNEATCPGIVVATPGRLQIRMDKNIVGSDIGDTDCADADEDLTFGFDSTEDATLDGIADTGAAAPANDGVASLGVLNSNVSANFVDMAEFIHAVGFAYAYDANGDGDLETYTLTSGSNAGATEIIWAYHDAVTGNWFNLDNDGNGVIDSADAAGATIVGTDTTDAFNLEDIRAVRIWVLARTESEDREYTNSNTYTVGLNVITPNDHFRRRLLETIVRIRNMGF
ncbi:MAG: PilW family protein [Desulfobulbaceae bacterium]|nr:PilW family protein [Desulfobulbaceae bacterium]